MGLIKTEKPLTLAWRARDSALYGSRAREGEHHDGVTHSRSQPGVREDVSSRIAVLHAPGFDDRPHHAVDLKGKALWKRGAFFFRMCRH